MKALGTVLVSLTLLAAVGVGFYQAGRRRSLDAGLVDVRSEVAQLGVAVQELKTCLAHRNDSGDTEGRVDQLPAVIRAAVDPESWREPDRSVVSYGAKLVVTQTDKVHTAVASFLGRLAGSDEPIVGVPSDPKRHGDQKWKMEIEKALKERRVSFDFVDTPLEDVIAYFTGAADMGLMLDRNALTQAGDVDIPVTLKVKDMRLGAALEWTLRLCNLAYLITDEAVLITDPRTAEGKPSTKVYDVTRIIESRKPAAPTSANYLPRNSSSETRSSSFQ